MWSLKCRQCSHEIRVGAEDVDGALELNRYAKSYEADRISRQEFLVLVKSTRLACVEEIRRIQTVIVCPHCGEESPGTFARCWKCSGQLAELEADGEAAGATPDRATGTETPDKTSSAFGGIRL